MKKTIKTKKPIKKTTKKKMEKTIKKKTKEEFSKEMTFAELLGKSPECANILFESGLHCIGCGGAMYETIEQGCLMHGFSEKQIDDLIKKLNKSKKSEVSSICEARNSKGKSGERNRGGVVA